jgi:Ca-activated chloride channel family protein
MMKKVFATVLFLYAIPVGQVAQEAKPGAPAALPQSTAGKIVSNVELVNVLMTVTDKKNRMVIDKTKDDFHVYEDGKPQTVQYFSRESDLPLRIAILIDSSNSVRDRLRFEQEAAVEFLINTIRKGKDLAFVVGFDMAPQLIIDYSDDREKLGDAIRSLQAGGVTSMYDAIYFSCKEKLYYFPPPEPYLRRVMILISDGQDNQSEHTREEALAMAQRAEVTIFAISTNRSGSEEKGDRILKRIAEETGGRVFFPFAASDLSEDFAAIGREIRSQYSLAYFSTNRAHDGTFRKILIEPLAKNLQVRSKAGYFALTQ